MATSNQSKNIQKDMEAIVMELIVGEETISVGIVHSVGGTSSHAFIE